MKKSFKLSVSLVAFVTLFSTQASATSFLITTDPLTGSTHIGVSSGFGARTPEQMPQPPQYLLPGGSGITIGDTGSTPQRIPDQTFMDVLYGGSNRAPDGSGPAALTAFLANHAAARDMTAVLLQSQPPSGGSGLGSSADEFADLLARMSGEDESDTAARVMRELEFKRAQLLDAKRGQGERPPMPTPPNPIEPPPEGPIDPPPPPPPEPMRSGFMSGPGSELTSLSMSYDSDSMVVSPGGADRAPLQRHFDEDSAELTYRTPDFGYTYRKSFEDICSECETMTFGEWTGDDGTSGHWIVGTAAEAEEIERMTGSASYSGNALGQVGGETARGFVDIGIDFDNRTGNYELGGFSESSIAGDLSVDGGAFSNNAADADHSFGGAFGQGANTVFGGFKAHDDSFSGIFGASRTID